MLRTGYWFGGWLQGERGNARRRLAQASVVVMFGLVGGGCGLSAAYPMGKGEFLNWHPAAVPAVVVGAALGTLTSVVMLIVSARLDRRA